MRVVVDHDLCQGHAMCELEAPAVFQVGKSDTVNLLTERPAEEDHDAVRLAVKYCPTHALSLEEES
jgi:sterol 14-demethylase